MSANLINGRVVQYRIQQKGSSVLKPIERFYKKENDVYLIELRFNKIEELFDKLDPSVLEKKDLNQTAERYLLDVVADFNPKIPLKMLFYLPKTELEKSDSDKITTAVHNYFEYRSRSEWHNFENIMKEGRRTLIIGLIFLSSCLALTKLLSVVEWGMAGAILQEGFLISGWVAMWRPIQIFLYDWWPILKRFKQHQRLSQMDVELITD